MSSLISCREVSVRFADRTTAVDHLQLEVDAGEFLNLVGPSGAGKSTLLRLLAADILPSEGTVLLDGKDPAEWSKLEFMTWRRATGYAPHGLTLLLDRSIRENVAYALRIRGGAAWHDALAQADCLLERLGLGERTTGWPMDLSGGEQQRAVFAQAITGPPLLVLADEPTSNLDPANARLVIALLSELNEGGATVVVATHNPELRALKSARTIVLDGGRIAPRRRAGALSR
jgi:ABC-type ATPase involved in cell division